MADKLVANMDMAAFGKAEELKKRLWFTIMALIVFRLGTYIPLPGINAAVLAVCSQVIKGDFSPAFRTMHENNSFPKKGYSKTGI